MNTILRLMTHPDTNQPFDLIMSDEEWTAAQSDPQVIRDKVAAKLAAEAAAQADLDETRGNKVQTALASIVTDQAVVDTDLLNVSTATAAQVRDMVQRLLQREKRALVREAVLIKALMRLAN